MSDTSFIMHQDAIHAVNRLQLQLFEASVARIDWRGRNCFSFNRLFFPRRGQGLVINHHDGKRYQMKPGKALFMPPRADLEFEFKDDLEFFAFHFAVEILPGFDFFSGCRSCLEYLPHNDFLTELDRLYTQEIRFTGGMLLSSLLWREISAIGQTLAVDNPMLRHQEKYRELAEFLHRRARADLSVHDVAQAIGKNYDSLSREIKADLHLTLKEMLFRELQRQAEVLLLSGENTVKETAAKLGFASEFYFSKFFKRRTGLPPSRYRNFPQTTVSG